jgi:magnesium chelatase subunit I
VFTANPEDYTNRGAIVTPLKDRIESQILTHYPKNIPASRQITEQEAHLHHEAQEKVKMNELIKNLVEQVAFEARRSEYIDPKSGVSARLSISAYENLVSTAERRMLLHNENNVFIRISDFSGVVQSITGKVELVYEGEQEGTTKVAHILIGKAIRSQFPQYFPNPENMKKKQNSSPYQKIINWFAEGHSLDLLSDIAQKEYEAVLNKVPGLKELVKEYHPGVNREEMLLLMEFILFGLAEYSFLSKYHLEQGMQFKDLLNSMLPVEEDEEKEEEGDLYR